MIKRISLTDLDVLGIKYDYLFNGFRIVGDCKTGKNISDISRLFWLKGVKDYFGADEAYYIHSNVKNHTKNITPKLGLRVLDEKSLSELEKNLNIIHYFLPLSDISEYEKVSNQWNIKIPRGTKLNENQLLFKKIYTYLSYSYWYIEQYRNLLNVIENFSSISSLLDPRNDKHVLLAFTGLERFAHSMLEAASYVFSQGSDNVPRDFRTYIYGGPLSLREKETFFKLMRELTKTNEQLDPPFIVDLYELMGRMVRNPMGAFDILRHIQAIYLWCVHLRNDKLLPLDNDQQNTAAIVLTRDLAKTFCKITGLNADLFRSINAL
jgi:hypothetical protein